MFRKADVGTVYLSCAAQTLCLGLYLLLALSVMLVRLQLLLVLCRGTQSMSADWAGLKENFKRKHRSCPRLYNEQHLNTFLGSLDLTRVSFLHLSHFWLHFLILKEGMAFPV